MNRRLRPAVAAFPLTIAASGFLYALCAFAIVFGLVSHQARHNYLSDFGTFVLAARALDQGRDPYAFDSSLISNIASYFDPDAVNLNAPFSLVLLAPLAQVEPFAAFDAWLLISVLLYAGSVTALIRMHQQYLTPRHLALAAGLVGFWFGLLMGQIYIAMLAVVVLIRSLLARNHDVLAGLSMGILIALKPQFAIWPALLFLADHKRAALSSLMSALFLGSLPLVLYGPNVYSQWLEAAARKTTLDHPLNASLFAATSRLDLPWLGIGISVLLLAALALWAWSYHPDPMAISSAAIVAVILVGPTGWLGTLVWTLPAFFVRRWPALFWLSAALLLLPGRPVAVLTQAWPGFGFVYTLALLLLLVGVVRHFGPAQRQNTVGMSLERMSVRTH
ncbi:MAG: glycosyltransferase family 87 protein [Sphingomonadaceae bacterium]